MEALAAARITKKTMIAVMLVFAAAVAPSVEARPSTLGYMVYGQGTDSCGTWTENRKTFGGNGNQLAYADEVWLNGYLTSYNAWAPGVVDIRKPTDSEGAYAWIDSYCAAHPLDNLATAGGALIVELRKRNIP